MILYVFLLRMVSFSVFSLEAAQQKLGYNSMKTSKSTCFQSVLTCVHKVLSEKRYCSRTAAITLYRQCLLLRDCCSHIVLPALFAWGLLQSCYVASVFCFRTAAVILCRQHRLLEDCCSHAVSPMSFPLGLLQSYIISEITYNVSSGMLNHTIPCSSDIVSPASFARGLL